MVVATTIVVLGCLGSLFGTTIVCVIYDAYHTLSTGGMDKFRESFISSSLPSEKQVPFF